MIDKDKIKEAKALLKVLKKSQKRGIFSNVFSFLKDDIFALKEKGLSNNAIVTLLSEALNEKIAERNLSSWLYRQYKQKKKSVENVKQIKEKKAVQSEDTKKDDTDEKKNAFAFLKTTK